MKLKCVFFSVITLSRFACTCFVILYQFVESALFSQHHFSHNQSVMIGQPLTVHVGNQTPISLSKFQLRIFLSTCIHNKKNSNNGTFFFRINSSASLHFWKCSKVYLLSQHRKSSQLYCIIFLLSL